MNENQNELNELEEVKQKAEEYLAGWKRSMADYQNREKEIAARFEDLAKFGAAETVRAILPVLDNLRASFDHLPPEAQSNGWAKGIALVVKQFEDVLRGLGVEMIVTTGIFDPARHESVGSEPVEGAAPGSIVKIVSPGYTIHGRILRPSKVIISK